MGAAVVATVVMVEPGTVVTGAIVVGAVVDSATVEVVEVLDVLVVVASAAITFRGPGRGHRTTAATRAITTAAPPIMTWR